MCKFAEFLFEFRECFRKSKAALVFAFVVANFCENSKFLEISETNQIMNYYEYSIHMFNSLFNKEARSRTARIPSRFSASTSSWTGTARSGSWRWTARQTSASRRAWPSGSSRRCFAMRYPMEHFSGLLLEYTLNSDNILEQCWTMITFLSCMRIISWSITDA